MKQAAASEKRASELRKPVPHGFAVLPAGETKQAFWHGRKALD